jgi:hypothetical protein
VTLFRSEIKNHPLVRRSRGRVKILFDPRGDPWQPISGKRRRCRGRSHEWQPEWVGSSVPGATISQAFEDKSLGGFVFYGSKILRPALLIRGVFFIVVAR